MNPLKVRDVGRPCSTLNSPGVFFRFDRPCRFVLSCETISHCSSGSSRNKKQKKKIIINIQINVADKKMTTKYK